MARAQAVVQHGLREFAVGHAREVGVERQDVEDVDAQPLQRARLLVGFHQQKGGLAGAEMDARVRVEGDDAKRAAEFAGGLGGERDHLLVAAVDAVEIAHRHRRAAVAVGQVLPALDEP